MLIDLTYIYDSRSSGAQCRVIDHGANTFRSSGAQGFFKMSSIHIRSLRDEELGWRDFVFTEQYKR